jgi:AcrR family transcriptional regulator
MAQTRAERRRSTEVRILAAARGLFAERGFERTTIRAVAEAAHVDPALVMQYFGSKQDLFKRALRVADADAGHGDEPLTEVLLATLGVKIGGLPDTSLAMLRSMLTHPEAAEVARAALGSQVDGIAASIDAPDARLRAALLTSTMLGVTIAHQLLGVESLRDADRDEIADLLRPCLQSLLGE